MFSPYASVVLRSISTSSTITRNVSLITIRLLVLAVILIESASMTRAQGYNATPLGAAPGAPAGSYELSDLENINLYNGNLNFRLPLLEIIGRGGTKFPIALVNAPRWTVARQLVDPSVPDYYYDLPRSPSQLWRLNVSDNQTAVVYQK